MYKKNQYYNSTDFSCLLFILYKFLQPVNTTNYTLSIYSPVLVSTLTLSPSLTNKGTWIT